MLMSYIIFSKLDMHSRVIWLQYHISLSLICFLIFMVYLFARIGVYVNGKTIFEFGDRFWGGKLLVMCLWLFWVLLSR